MPEVLINNSYSLQLSDQRAAQWHEWHAGGGWEVERIDATISAINEVAKRTGNPRVYDIGAERGDLPALWATRGARVVLVEPSPLMWPHIREVFELNDQAHRVAGCWHGFAGNDSVTGIDAQPWTAGPWPHASRSPVIPEPGFMHLDEGGAPMITVDALAALADEPPDIITIDVEGSELEVLRGAQHTLGDVRPVVFVSVHPEFMEDRHGHTPSDVIDFMNEHNYEGTLLATDHEEHWQFMPGERT